MIGKIVEIEGKDGLFLVIDYKNDESVGSCSYDRDYWIYPYDSSFDDDVTINLNDCIKYELRGTKNTVAVREDKKAYTQYGYSVVRNIKKVMLERIWDKVIVQTR